MDCCHYITDLPERKSGQHLQREERGAIQALKRQGLSNRAIARELGCSPTTIGNELRRGTPPRKSSKGRTPGYSAKHGEAVYRSNRFRSRKPHKLLSCGAFVSWVAARSENTSDLWMPAPAAQNATDCFRATRWSVPTRSIMKRGQVIFPLGSWSCRKL